MKKFLLSIRRVLLVCVLMLFINSVHSQSYLIGPVNPYIGTNASYTSFNHFDLFNVLSSTGVIIDSMDIYPTSSTAGGAYTVVVQNSSTTEIASYSGITTAVSSQPERIKVNFFIPQGTGYRLGLSANPGMLRNSTGPIFPYTVPGVMSFTGATYQTTYWYFFYNIRITSIPTNAGISAITAPGDTICSGSQPVSITLKNYGPVAMTSAKINWKVNNVVQPLYNWTGSLAVNATTSVNIGSYNFLSGIGYNILAYSSEPNTLADTINSNDTIVKTGIVVKQSPSAALTTTNTDICPGDSITISGTLTGTAPWILVINDGTTNHTLSNLLTAGFTINFKPVFTTTYTLVSVADSSGCSSTPGQSVVITVLPVPPATINPLSSTTFCIGDSVVLEEANGPGLSYQWYKDSVSLPGDTNYIFIAKNSGAYSIEVFGTNGCSALSAPVNVTVNPIPVVHLGNDTTIGISQSLTLDAGSGFVSYLWSTGDTTQTIIADTTGIGTGIGIFSVTVTDANACEGFDDIQITFITNPGIDEIQSSNICTIFPNPARDKIYILISPASLPVDLVIFNSLGIKVFERKCKDNVEINTSDWPRGVYSFIVRNNRMKATKNVIIN